MIILPTHTFHALQPLDVSYLRYSKQHLEKWRMQQWPKTIRWN